MKLTLESTARIVELYGPVMRGRVWQGETEDGIPVVALIAYVVPELAPDDPRQEQFLLQLEECATPRPMAEAIDMRLIL